MNTSISSKGQIVLPVEFRREDHILPGEMFEIERVAEGEYMLTRKTPPRNQGLVELLLACPMKDWMQAVDRTETTEDVRAARLG